MPLTWEIDTSRRRLVVCLAGALVEDELLAQGSELLGHPQLQPGLDLLSDHTALEGVASTEFVRHGVDFLGRLASVLGRYRCALVAPGEAAFGMARMAALLAESTPVTVMAFRERSEAEGWLEAAREGTGE